MSKIIGEFMNDEIKKSPVCLFGYNRPNHIKKCIDSLARCPEAKDTILYIYCDGAKNNADIDKCDDVRALANYESKCERFKTVVVNISDENKGLAKSIITGVTEVISKYGKCIVLEDDLVVSKYYLKFMNEGLEYYQNNERIWSITGYTYPLKYLKTYNKDVYLSYRICSYGWGTWKDRWEKVDWNVSDYQSISHSIKKIREFNRGGNDMFRTLQKCVIKGLDVWAIRFSYAQYQNSMFTIYPRITLLKSNGYDGCGTNSQPTSKYNNLEIDEMFSSFHFDDVELNKGIVKEFKKHYRFSIKEWIKYRYSRWRKKRSYQ